MSDFRYRLNSAPVAFSDGSGCIGHDINAMFSDDGGETWAVVPAHHKTVLVPDDEMKVVMDMPNTAAKIAAYKQVLVDNLNTQNTPIAGWGIAQMQAMVDANEAATLEAGNANTYITVTLGLSYPVSFDL